MGYRPARVPLTLDPGNLPALNLRVVNRQVATLSHVCPSDVPWEGGHSLAARFGRAHAVPDESTFRSVQRSRSVIVESKIRNQSSRFMNTQDERDHTNHGPGSRGEPTIMIGLAEKRGRWTDPLT
ncbi:hypothetical protein CRG98_015284 [Punica granatum]|uniref:Uncharacterized protein n=1 Tax=Punica granatum TaxID=22663 RepID=A0A2I0K6Y9_PUNGR|nr:hypothetical protein CRG98_015284 [Punica granatum]